MSLEGGEPGCLFCDINSGRAEANIVYADDQVIAITSLERNASVHLLLIPRRHIPSIDALRPDDQALWWHLLEVAQTLARREGIDIEGEGYHLVTNAGRHHRRAYPHLHVHLVSGALE